MEIKIIEGRYTDKAGDPVTIISTSARGDYPIKAIIHNRDFDGIGAFKSLDELVKIPSLEDLKVDDRVLVRNNRDKWVKRHFANVSDSGNCVTFAGGITSWSVICDDEYSEWDEWKLPDQIEV